MAIHSLSIRNSIEAMVIRPRIMLADDDFVARRLISALLKHMGFNVETYDNGEAALAAVQGSAFDIIILDIDMPGMDGLTAAREIRSATQSRYRPRIIAMSGYLMDFQGDVRWSELFDSSIAKPVTRFRLEDAIYKLMQEKSLSVRHINKLSRFRAF